MKKPKSGGNNKRMKTKQKTKKWRLFSQISAQCQEKEMDGNKQGRST